MSRTPPALILAVASLVAVGCGQDAKAPAESAEPRTTLVTTTTAQRMDFEVIERTVGSVESPIDPTVTAEVSGRVRQVLARAGDAVRSGQLLAVIDAADLKLARQGAAAEVARIEALLVNQNAILERNRQLVESNFISQTALDESIAQQRALAEQLAAAKSQLARVESDIAKTRVSAPLDARIDLPLVSEGDYVQPGTPMFELVSTQVLNIYLPFPETIAPRLKIGLPVTISSPVAEGDPIEARIDELKPGVVAGSRAVNAIVRMRGSLDWRPGASVDGAVKIDVRRNAVVAPEQSVILRPAGKVVYVIEGGRAMQRVVETGYKREGLIEIVSGLDGDETIAVDGAGFLTDGAAVSIQASETAER
ncbi:MAG: efflux RND transporter periplasmic adaptor subunit [Burkholderiales bacterium]